MMMMIKPYFRSWWALLTCLLSACPLGLLGYNLGQHVWRSCDILSVPTISHDTCERAVSFVITDDLTPHVWKSCDVLLVRMMSHYTPERVVTCYQYGWSHTTRLKELWSVISTDDLTPHVWKSCEVLSVRMVSHHTSERVVKCDQYGWSHTIMSPPLVALYTCHQLQG